MKKDRKALPQGLRFDVFRRDNFRCVYCGQGSPDVVLECDHKMARANGGDDTMSNLVTACYDCNRGKSAKVVEFEPPKYPEIFKKSHPLTGKFGHTLEREDGEVFANYQFQILDVQDDIATVQLFSWGIPPGPNGTMVLSVGELMNRERCALYGDQESWIRYGDLSGQRRIAKIRRLRAG